MYLQATWIWKHADTCNDAACLAREEGVQCVGNKSVVILNVHIYLNTGNI